MNCKAQPRFDTHALRNIAGDGVFARGEAYHRDGQVEILSIEREHVLARVAGTQDYRAELTGRGSRIRGACSCRAFADGGFCKHLVAVALTANARGDAEGGDALTRIRDHLKKKTVDALAGMIVDMAARDLALFRKLDAAAAIDRDDDKTLETRLRKAIDGATRTGGYVEYQGAASWAVDVDAVLDAVADLVSGGRASLALRLAELAIDRIERAIEYIDDSDGHVGGLLDRARDLHLAAARLAPPDPVRLARDLFARETDGEYDTFIGAATLYADVLGEQGLAEYRRLAVQAWAKLPARSGKKSGEDEEHFGRHGALRDILDVFAAREGDVEARIALRAKDLSSQGSYLQLAEFCHAHGRDEEALQRAEEGLWLFEDDRPDNRLVFLLVDLLSKAGRTSDAEAQLWRAFEKEPGLELYARLRELGGTAARERAIALLQARLDKETRTSWNNPADLVINIQVQEEMLDAAWANARAHRASTSVMDALAQASEVSHPAEALAVYAGRVDELVSSGNNRAYAEAVKFIIRMAALRSAAAQAVYIADIKARFGRKRNFMKLLE